MPAIFRLDGYRFYFYSHEPDEPPHVHVDKGGASHQGLAGPGRNGPEHRLSPIGDQWHNRYGGDPSGPPAGGVA